MSADRYPVRILLPDREVELLAGSEEYLLYAALDAGLDWPHVCEQGWCLACAARLLAGDVDLQDAFQYFPEDARAGFILMCSAKPRSPLILQHDPHRTRREFVQHRLTLGLPVRRAPAIGWRRGRKQPQNSDIPK